MKKFFAMLLAALLAVSCFSVVCFAENTRDLVKVLMSTPGTTFGEDAVAVSREELDSAVENAAEGVIPAGATFQPGRVTLLRTGSVTGGREVYDVTFKVWSTVNRTTGLFFRATGTDEWELISCYAGELDVIEGRFYADGDYAIAVGW